MSANLRTAVVLIFSAFAMGGAEAQQPDRKELKRADLTGTNMEVVISIIEFKPGVVAERHIHHGEEAFYVLEGATLELPNGQTVNSVTGGANINARNAPHGAFKVMGDKSLKLLTVHIVDKGKPLYDSPQ